MDTRPRPITDYKIVLTSLNNAVLTTDQWQENFFIDGVNIEDLPEDYFYNVSPEDKALIYKYTKFSANQYSELWGKNLLTNLDREIKSAEDVVKYLHELVKNDETYNFCNPAFDMVEWRSRTPSMDECYKLDKLYFACLGYCDAETIDGILLDEMKKANRF